MEKGPLLVDPENPLGHPANQTLGPVDRKRLSGAGLRTFLAIADAWGLDEEARYRVTGILRQKIYERCCTRAREHLPLMLGTDVLERISNVLRIHMGLTVLFADQREALRWLSGPHDASPFDGRAPIEAIKSGDFEDLVATRSFLGAACTGLYMSPLPDDVGMRPYDDSEIKFDTGGS